MNKSEFLGKLTNRLAHLPNHEISKIISYYDESIDDRIEDGMTEEVSIQSLGSLDNIVINIENEIPITSMVKDQVMKKVEKNSSKKVLLAFTIIGSPLWLPLLLAAVCLVLSLVLAGWAVYAGGVVTYLSLAIVAVTGVGFGFIRVFTVSITTGLAYIGVGILSAGIMLLLFYPCLWLTRQWVKLNVLPFKKLRQRLVRKE
ncbi:hypothetical protein SANA_25470 [Gottschalkiaceae bacterium SANA]|nr:hypothetical protein SANA_25470 [Gottschalkiaceae bacterium SANA]